MFHPPISSHSDRWGFYEQYFECAISYSLELMVLGAFLQVVAYAISAAALPFPVLCVAYAINGVGMALLVIVPTSYIFPSS
jgi:hypothetical protein